MRKQLLIIALLSLTPAFAFNQAESIYSAIENGDYNRADSLLSLWESADGNNPELAVAKFNRYINESRNSMILLTGDVSSEGEGFFISDSANNVVGSIREGVEWNDSLYKKAVDVISDAIEHFPDRLDLRFGYAAALSMRNLNEDLVNVLKRTMKHGKAINFRWLWTDNEPVDKPEAVLVNGIWDYCSAIYNSDEDALAFELSEDALTYFPSDLRFINMCGAIKYLSGSYDDALAYFNRALQISPEDEIVLGNIAQVCFQVGRYDEVKKICDRIISMDGADASIKDFAQDMKIKVNELSSGSCEKMIKDFYVQYMTNSERDWDANAALCDSVLAPAVMDKLREGIEEPDADYIIRAQDVSQFGIRSLRVVPLPEKDWYMVRYQWSAESDPIDIPLKAVIKDDRLKILYITPLRLGSSYGDALLKD